jgi:tripartite-type tricarboxylate transporter receptor subunit TctC
MIMVQRPVGNAMNIQRRRFICTAEAAAALAALPYVAPAETYPSRPVRIIVGFTRDITALAGIMRVAFVMVVNPSLPVTTVPALIAYARANPRKLSVGSGGAGGPDQASSEYFKMETDVASENSDSCVSMV